MKRPHAFAYERAGLFIRSVCQCGADLGLVLTVRGAESRWTRHVSFQQESDQP